MPIPLAPRGALTVSWVSLAEVARFFQAIGRRKHRAILLAVSAARLRIAEVTAVRLSSRRSPARPWYRQPPQRDPRPPGQRPRPGSLRHARLTTITLDAGGFIRRVLLHLSAVSAQAGLLPDGVTRVHPSGRLSNRHRAAKLAGCRARLGLPEPTDPAPPPPPDWTTRYQALTGEPVDRCPACRQGRLRRVEALPRLSSLPAPPPAGIDS